MGHPTDDANFRLPESIRPRRYDARLSLDLDARRFEGRATIALTLASPADEIVLHAVDLELRRAVFRTGGEAFAATEMRPAPASETVVVGFPEKLPWGEGELEVEWSGRFSDGLRGLYLAEEAGSAGGRAEADEGGRSIRSSVAVTQFEACDARRVFPCFDEPAFKAVWALTLEVPERATALSNGAPVKETPAGPGRKVVAFAETPPLSSYLVALAVGELGATPEARAGAVPVRTWSVPEKSALARFGQDVAVNVLPRLTDYFGLPYAFGKLDQVGVPDFEAGAMENAGLVTYREVALLLDPATASLPVQKRVAEVVTHELSHQWFGNWVTMAWWDDLWLNESFATWMAFKIVDGWRPEWRVWLDFDQARASALHLDALRSTHPIRNQEVKNAAQATESFDAITYEKGGAVLRMIEGFLGEKPFRDGIRAYLRAHGKANATADDLWSALEAASRQPVVELANSWIRKPGYPLVHARLDGRSLSLSQHRFFSEPGLAGGKKAEAERPQQPIELWPVPVVLRWRDGAGIHEERRLLRDDAEIALPGRGPVDWLVGNGGATGFYRVAYDAALLRKLGDRLSELSPSERISLLADQWALVRAGADVEPFLDLLARYGGETDHAVLDEVVARLSAIEHRLLRPEARPHFEAFVGRLLGRQLDAVGWDPAPAEDAGTRLRRAALVRAIGLVARSPAVAAEAAARLDRYFGGDGKAIEANLHDPVVALAARGGGAARFDSLRKRYEAETDPAFKRRYLHALAAFEAPDQAARARALAFGEGVPLQDLASYCATLLVNPAARDPFWDELHARWDEVMARASGAPMLLRRIVEALGALPERRHLDAVAAFLEKHPIEVAKQATAQTLERMRQDVALRERLLAPVAAWLGRGPAKAAAPATPPAATRKPTRKPAARAKAPAKKKAARAKSAPAARPKKAAAKKPAAKRPAARKAKPVRKAARKAGPARKAAKKKARRRCR